MREVQLSISAATQSTLFFEASTCSSFLRRPSIGGSDLTLLLSNQSSVRLLRLPMTSGCVEQGGREGRRKRKKKGKKELEQKGKVK